MTGYQALVRSLRELECNDRDEIVKLSSAIQTLLNDCSNATYNEHIEQAIPKFDELLLSFSTLIVELATKPTPVTDKQISDAYKLLDESGFIVDDPTICPAGINSVPGAEMGEDYAVLGGQ